MSAATGHGHAGPAAIPWADRADPVAAPTVGGTRSARDLDILRSLARRIPVGDARAHNNLGVVYYRNGLYAEAVEQLERALELDPDMQVAERNLHIVYFASGYYDERVSGLHTRLELDADDQKARRRLALAYLYGGDPAAAIVEWRKLLQAFPRDARLHEQIAWAERKRGNLEAAELNPGDVEAEDGLSLDGHSVARYEELVGDRSSRPRVAEGGTLSHFNLGVAFRQKGLYDEALREFRLAAEQGEDPFLVLQARAEMVLLCGGGEEAAELYGQLIEQEPASPKLYNELGVAQHQQGRLVAAERAYRRALELDPAYALAWNNLGVVRHHRGDDADAEAAFRTGLDRTGPLAGVWRNLGLILERVGREAEAETAYRHAVETDSGVAAAWTGLGTRLLEKGDPEEARSALARAVEADPQLAEARYHFAFALSATGDYAAALRETRIALELNPYIPSPRFQLLIDLQFEEAGIFAPELDAPDRLGIDAGATVAPGFDFEPVEPAETTLRDALESNANAPATRAALGQLFMKRGQTEDARREFVAALDAIPSYGAAAIGLAELETAEGRTREAIHVLAELLTVDPYHLPALVRLGDLLSAVGRESEASMAYRRALRLDAASPGALAGLERLVPTTEQAGGGGNGGA